MTGYKDFIEKIAQIFNAPRAREGRISDLELSDLGLSRAAGHVAIW